MRGVRAGEVILADGRGGFLAAATPVGVCLARSVGDVDPLLREVEAWTEAGGVAIGFLAYEAAPAFDPAMRVYDPTDFPLVWFGLYRDWQRWDALPAPRPVAWPQAWTPTVNRAAYDAAFGRVRAYLRAGDTYQVNYTYRLRSRFEGDARSAFLWLARAQPSACLGYVDTGRWAVCSASPELFLELRRGRLLARPMKGTAPRGLWIEADRGQAAALGQAPKDRAENVMIVDMIRNDMGRVARAGSVTVPKRFEVERYPTVWQMTSTVRARTAAGWREVLHALFPCASITGAPKIRTMQIIREIESTPRGVYTGAVGILGPGRRARFNVAIRTLVVDRERGAAEYGVGGGIVWDSSPRGEFDESLAKAAVLTCRRPDFELLETLLWRPGPGFFLLGRHLARVRRSAVYFGIPLRRDRALRALNDAARRFDGAGPRRVRLRVSRTGACGVTAALFAPAAGAWRVKPAAEPVDSRDVFLYHKTTHRAVYERALRGVREADDVLLYNARGELTESTRANIVLVMGGRHVTPPVRCGLLAGTCREEWLRRGRIAEAVLPRDMLPQAEAIYLINALRGRIETRLVS